MVAEVVLGTGGGLVTLLVIVVLILLGIYLIRRI